MLVISYDSYRKYAAKINAVGSIGLLVCDEGHRLKNDKGSKTMQALQGCPARRRILLTGTPVQNDLGELYAMANFVRPGALGEVSAFKRIYSNPIKASRDRSATVDERTLGQNRNAHLTKLLAKFILRRDRGVMAKNLPPLHEQVRGSVGGLGERAWMGLACRSYHFRLRRGPRPSTT